ncbi:hypothetical protein Tco_0393759 [Tanacetum coccineum]
MDAMTADLCKHGRGKVGYARILVEVNAKRGFMEQIELVYIIDKSEIKGSKFVKVETNEKKANHASTSDANGEFTSIKNNTNGMNNTGENMKQYNNTNVHTRNGRPPIGANKEYKGDYVNKQRNSNKEGNNSKDCWNTFKKQVPIGKV